MAPVASIEQLPIRAARAGDPGAWDVLFRRYQLPLYAYVFELVHDEQASLDIVQETFIGAARHVAQLRDDARFGSWLFGIAHQKCLQRWRRAKADLVPIEPVAESLAAQDPLPGEWLVKQEEEEHFMKALNLLSPAHRAVLLLHFIEDFSLAEIAAVTGADLGTVKSRLHYAKKALRKFLEDYEKPT